MLHNFFNRRFLFSALLLTAALLYSSADTIAEFISSGQLFPYGEHGQLIYEGIDSAGFHFFLPIAAVLPYSAQYVSDLKAHRTRYILCRITYRNYLMREILGSALSGGLVCTAGICLGYAVSALILPFWEVQSTNNAEVINWISRIAGRIPPVFLSGALWAMIGSMLSTWMESPYIAYAGPFIFYYVLIMLHSRYCSDLYLIDPTEWIVPGSRWLFGRAGTCIFLIELIILAAGIFWLQADRRIRNL